MSEMDGGLTDCGDVVGEGAKCIIHETSEVNAKRSFSMLLFLLCRLRE
jgi:hypothetical protein